MKQVKDKVKYQGIEGKERHKANDNVRCILWENISIPVNIMDNTKQLVKEEINDEKTIQTN